jgi:branched-subunit amino acid transport protein AzlD
MSLHIALMIAVMMLVTWGLRALPFFFKDWLNAHPFIAYIKNRFPLIMMLILVVYASEVYKAQHLNDVKFALLGIAFTALLQLVFKNYLISLFGGVAMYVMFINGLI